MKILITAGSTWIKIDEVRILTTIFTGSTGLFLAQALAKKNHQITLVINPFRLGSKIKVAKNIKIIPFYYFEELNEQLSKLLAKDSYDVIIHNAAVSDYRLLKPFKGKIPSRKDKLNLTLVPTQKLIKMIRQKAKKAKIIQFKLETNKDSVIKKAIASLKENNSDFVVANLLSDVKSHYKAWLISKSGQIIKLSSKEELVNILSKVGNNYLNKDEDR